MHSIKVLTVLTSLQKWFLSVLVKFKFIFTHINNWQTEMSAQFKSFSYYSIAINSKRFHANFKKTSFFFYLFFYRKLFYDHRFMIFVLNIMDL